LEAWQQVITSLVARFVIADRYELEERIALGRMAEVWVAQDATLERRVVVKLLVESADPLRFAREARAAAVLSHPCICHVYDFGEFDGRPYIVLEHLSGGTLEDRLESGTPLPDEVAKRVAVDLSSALAHAHAHGVIHRDVKPANVLFDEDGTAKLTDFGLVRMEGLPTLTDAGTLLGTARYIAPEQARGERSTPASDVYSLGVVFYRMLTGRVPFEAENALDLAAMHADAELPPIRSLRPDVPPVLADVATAALAKRPEERPADGEAVLAALAGAQPDDEATFVIPPSTEGRRLAVIARHWRGRRRSLAAAGAVGVLVALGLIVALLANPDRSPAPVTTSQPAPDTAATRGHGTTATTPTTVGGGQTTQAGTTRGTSTRERSTTRPSALPPSTTASGATTSSPTSPTATTSPSTTTPETTTSPPATSTTTIPGTTTATTGPATTTTTVAAATTTPTTPPQPSR
jgi:eukaryotic-like serine/threonine-protein kinase